MIVTIPILLNNDVVQALSSTLRDSCITQLKENAEWKVFYPAKLKPADYSFVDFKTEICSEDNTKQIALIRYMLDTLPLALKNRPDIIVGE